MLKRGIKSLDYIPTVSKKKWIANPRNIAAITILMIESRIDISLPYLVYIIKTVKETSPITRNIHAKTHIDKEGMSAISN